MATRNPTWSRDELILALDLYFRLGGRPASVPKNHPGIVRLSDTLNQLPIHAQRPDAQRFRNPNGVYMKLCNFLRFDPSYTGAGLQGVGEARRRSGTSSPATSSDSPVSPPTSAP